MWTLASPYDAHTGSTLLDLFRASAIEEARAAAGRPADYRVADVEMLPPLLGAEKIICVGINYPERSAEYKDAREPPKYPNLFCRFPSSLVGTDQPIVRPKVSEKFDYEGEVILVIGGHGRHVPKDDALSMIGGSPWATKAPCATGCATARSM